MEGSAGGHSDTALGVISNYPHPGPLPSDGRGRTLNAFLANERVQNLPGDGMNSLSHRMGEGQGEGKRLSFQILVKRPG